jgi:hypothetical protein
LPLPDPAEREPLHRRAIDLRGYRRADGLFDIEARLTDTKGYAVDNRWRGRLEPGVPIHDMWLRLTVDDGLTVVAVAAATDAAPFAVCDAITPAFRRLEGLTIGPGWRRDVAKRLGGVQGCTHLVELLAPLATTAMQTIVPLRERTAPPDPNRPPGHLDTCHALRRDGPVVRAHYPAWYTGPEEAGEG